MDKFANPILKIEIRVEIVLKSYEQIRFLRWRKTDFNPPLGLKHKLHEKCENKLTQLKTLGWRFFCFLSWTENQIHTIIFTLPSLWATYRLRIGVLLVMVCFTVPFDRGGIGGARRFATIVAAYIGHTGGVPFLVGTHLHTFAFRTL